MTLKASCPNQILEQNTEEGEDCHPGCCNHHLYPFFVQSPQGSHLPPALEEGEG